MKWKSVARNCVDDGGNSNENIAEFVTELTQRAMSVKNKCHSLLKMMAGRNNCAIADALESVAQALHEQQNQGNLTVVEYATKFEELVKLCPHYNSDDAEGSKCIKFESELHPEIKQDVGYHEICRFSVLVNKCRIYDEDNKARYSHYKSIGENKGKGQYRWKPCDVIGHCANEYTSDENKCYKCGKIGHLIADCKGNVVTCYNYGEQGHISTNCKKRKKAQSWGKVFELSRRETTSDDRLIRVRSMVIDTPPNGSITNSLVCLKCPLTIYGKSFGMELTVMFLEMRGDGELMFVSAKQVEEFLKEEVHVFSMFPALGIDSKATMEELPVLCDFPEVFPDDISDFAPDSKVEFYINLVPETSLVLMTLYRMSILELSELKKYLEKPIEKKLV
ncbi:uncharacterized protein LOC127080888 [Lathyrus oleraceus]|uniref:uncharacterized protein LOC127080888 n=1 Tax=Pisum sativum TaxID=3888 RepID=UPI0021CF5AA1|nr:uncharacterized protein LOC127080888 [Pisum sativum]